MKNFIFIHVMKCAGTTTTRLLRERGKYYEDKCFKKEHRYFHIQFTARSERYIHRNFHPTPGPHKAVGGHMTIWKYEYLNWPLVTIIRDPIERLISYYTIWSRHKGNMSYDWTFQEFIRGCPNQMSNMLGLNLKPFLFVGLVEQYEESIKRMWELLDLGVPGKIKVWNKSRGKLKISEEDREYAETINNIDIRLYNEAVERFNR